MQSSRSCRNTPPPRLPPAALVPGSHVLVTPDGHRSPVRGTVERIAPEADPALHVVFIEASVDDGAPPPVAGETARVRTDGEF